MTDKDRHPDNWLERHRRNPLVCPTCYQNSKGMCVKLAVLTMLVNNDMPTHRIPKDCPCMMETIVLNQERTFLRRARAFLVNRVWKRRHATPDESLRHVS
jgi:hypothetical protein